MPISELETDSQLLRRILEQSPIATLIANEAGLVIYVNARYTQLTGYAQTEVIGHPLWILHHNNGNSVNDSLDSLREGVLAGHEWHGEFLSIKKNQESYWEEVAVAPIYNDQGTVTHFVVTKVDITERKEAERLSDAFLSDMKALQNLFLELTQIEDLDTLYLSMVDVGRKRLGIDRLALFLIDHERNEIVGTYGVDSEGATRDERAYREPIDTDHWTVEIFNSPHHTKYWDSAPLMDNGQPIGLGWKAAASLWDGQQPIGYLISDNFVNHQPPRPYEAELVSLLGNIYGHLIRVKQAAKSLREAEARQRALLSAIPDVIFRHHRDGTFLEYFASGPEQLVIPPEVLIGRKVMDVIPPERAVIHMSNIEQVLRTGESTIYEYTVSQPGRVRYFEAHMVAFAEDETLSIVRDITGRKQAQDQAFALAVERERVQVLNKFVQNTAHELRTPLSAISSNLYFISRAPDTDRREEYIRRAEDHIMRLSRLLDMVLTMTKLDSAVPFDFELANVNTLIEQTVVALEHTLNQKAIALHLQLSPSLPRISVDTRWLEEAIEHLVNNAIHFTPMGGHITLISEGRDDQKVAITIQDTGVGITSQAMPHIFERFWRHDEAHTTPGIGLGLSIAQQIVERLGGVIEVKSTPNEGSVITVVLPERQPERALEETGQSVNDLG